MQHWESKSAPSVSLARKTCPYMFTIQLSLTSATSTDCICPESRQSSCQPGVPPPAPRDPTGRPVSTHMKQILQELRTKRLLQICKENIPCQSDCVCGPALPPKDGVPKPPFHTNQDVCPEGQPCGGDCKKPHIHILAFRDRGVEAIHSVFMNITRCSTFLPPDSILSSRGADILSRSMQLCCRIQVPQPKQSERSYQDLRGRQLYRGLHLQEGSGGESQFCTVPSQRDESYRLCARPRER
jgi:hypothetical protein